MLHKASIPQLTGNVANLTGHCPRGERHQQNHDLSSGIDGTTLVVFVAQEYY